MTSIARRATEILGPVVRALYRRRIARFRQQLSRAHAIQRRLLFQKLRRGLETQFGRDHGLGEVKTLADFRRRIPIAGYDYYEPYIQRVAEGQTHALLPPGEEPLNFTLSSGTTGASKLIPVSKTWIKEFRQSWQLWGTQAFVDHPRLFESPKLLSIVGHWDMRRTASDVPCGMASGVSSRYQNWLIRSFYVVPAFLSEIEDVTARYYTILRLAVAQQVDLFSTATPATLEKFAQLGNTFRETLIRDIAQGTLSEQFDVPNPIRRRLRRRIRRPQPQRARQLEAIVEQTGTLFPKDYWNLELLCCWLGGTVGSAAQQTIRQYYGDVACRDIGLISSEGRMTIPLSDGTPEGVLDITSHYFEFVPAEEIDSPQPTVLECHELDEGRQYFLLPTTSSGLYRYNIYDVVRCTGYFGEAPMLEFLNKGQAFSDIDGEKMTEHHFVDAVSHTAAEFGCALPQFTAVPVRDNPPYYALMIEENHLGDRSLAERFLKGVDDRLQETNVMYATKREDGYLGPPHLVRIPAGSWTDYSRREVDRRGIADDHYKHPYLVVREDFLQTFPVREEIVPSESVLEFGPAA